MPTLSEQVREAMHDAKLSIRRAVELTGITEPALRRFMRADGDLNQDSMAKLLRVLLKQAIITDAIAEPEPLQELLSFINQKTRTPQELSSEYIKRVAEGVLDLRSADEQLRLLVLKAVSLLKDEHWVEMPAALQTWANLAMQSLTKGERTPALPNTQEASTPVEEIPEDPEADNRYAEFRRQRDAQNAAFQASQDPSMDPDGFRQRQMHLTLAHWRSYCEVYLEPVPQPIEVHRPGDIIYQPDLATNEHFLLLATIEDEFAKAAGYYAHTRVSSSELPAICSQVLSNKRSKSSEPDVPRRTRDTGGIGWRYAALAKPPPPKPPPPITNGEFLGMRLVSRKIGKSERLVIATEEVKQPRRKPRLDEVTNAST